MVSYQINNTTVFEGRTIRRGFMESSYIIVDYNIAPDVFKKVVEVKKMVASGKYKSVNDALVVANLSRTAFYKYKNFVFASNDSGMSNIATVAFTLDDVTGVLSEILSSFAKKDISVLTINQNIPINGIANITISLRISSLEINMGEIIDELKKIKGVNKVHLLAMN